LLPYHNLLVCWLVSNPYEEYAFPYEDIVGLRIFPLLWNNECPIEALLIHLRNKKSEQCEVIQHLIVFFLKRRLKSPASTSKLCTRPFNYII
jgi:hypothetical protein